MLDADALERFHSKVDKRGGDECWLWTGHSDSRGRGRTRLGGVSVAAPRLALALVSGHMPDRKTFACHTCDNPACCNPAHLWWGSHQDNIRDASAKGRLHNQQRTHCPAGHPYSGRNLRTKRGGSQRECLKCVVDAQRLRRERQRGGRPAKAPKLTADSVRAIRKAFADGTPRKEIERQYGIKQPHLSEILIRRIWKGVE